MESRMTICNMSIEMGARGGMIAPDETTFDYIKGKPFAPKGVMILDNEFETGATALEADLFESLELSANVDGAAVAVSVDAVVSAVAFAVFFIGKEAALTNAS